MHKARPRSADGPLRFKARYPQRAVGAHLRALALEREAGHAEEHEKPRSRLRGRSPLADGNEAVSRQRLGGSSRGR